MCNSNTSYLLIGYILYVFEYLVLHPGEPTLNQGYSVKYLFWKIIYIIYTLKYCKNIKYRYIKI
jgi:hypothetical protein